MSIPETIEAMRELTPEEIQTALAAIENEIFHARFKQALRQSETPANIRQLKHRYAQLKTVQAERRSAALAQVS